MQEDIAEEHEEDDGDIVVNHSPPMQQQPPRGIAQSTMGNFTAPRFQNMHQVPPHMQQQVEVDAGPAGRPQLAPSFTFGQRRNPINPAPAMGEEDLGFQFPQAGQQPTLQPDLSQGPTTHRRTPSEMAGVSPLMAEQVCVTHPPPPSCGLLFALP